MRDVAIVAFAQTRFVAVEEHKDEVEMIRGCVNEVLADSGLERHRIGFWCSGSCDYVGGLPFSFVAAIDALGAWPPISESHVEMDGAFALYEAWVRLQHGDIDSALVYAFGKPSLGNLAEVMSQQLDPYVMGPLWADPASLAGLAARALLDAGKASERDLAEVSARSLRDSLSNRHAHGGRDLTPQQVLDTAYVRAPLRAPDCATQSDGAAAIVLVSGALARSLEAGGKKLAWIRGIDHRIDSMSLGLRDITTSPSTRLAAERAGARGKPVDVAELHAQFSSEELVLRDAIGLPPTTRINPSGGCFGANAPMVAGLVRIGEASARIRRGEARTALAHASSGPCLQQNLICLLEG